jgi:hypothetical protein
MTFVPPDTPRHRSQARLFEHSRTLLAVAITAALGLGRSACRKVIQDELLIRLLLRLDDLELAGVNDLMQRTRASLDVALVQQQQ